GTFTLRVLQTSTFQNSSLVDMEWLGLLEDIELGSVDMHTWSTHFYQPWVDQAVIHSDWHILGSSTHKSSIWAFPSCCSLLGLHLADPFVIQMHAGCALYPNGTSRGSVDVGADGRDFVAFKVERLRWEAQQRSPLAEYVSKSLNKDKSVRALLEHLLTVFCQNHVLTLYRYGKADLERQEPPVATVFALTPSPAQLLLVCRVTGFYPRPISVAWLRDGQEVPPGPALSTSSILPNADLTYQLRSILALSPRDGHSYACRVRHRSLGTRSLLVPWG
ncbi:CD1D protein, partial [Psilopogon haemacephalus]|nr:CD1D protein [Psilopogon haemacephalus]